MPPRNPFFSRVGRCFLVVFADSLSDFPKLCISHGSAATSKTNGCLYKFLVPNTYTNGQDLTLKILYGAAGANQVTYLYRVDSSRAGIETSEILDNTSEDWNVTTPERRYLHTQALPNTDLNEGDTILVRIFLTGASTSYCYGVWIEM